MTDYINIGCTPIGVECAQVGSDNYHDMARLECRVFLAQLRRVFGEEPIGARLRVKSFPHDFGEYFEVVCFYEENLPESETYAFKLENETPAKWDDKAVSELFAKGTGYGEYLIKQSLRNLPNAEGLMPEWRIHAKLSMEE